MSNLYPSNYVFGEDSSQRLNLNPMTNNSFGTVKFPERVENLYKQKRGQAFHMMPESQYYWRDTPPPGATLTKAGASYNMNPMGILPGKSPIPQNMVGIEAPVYSSNTGGPLETQRVGRQVGVADPATDSPYQDWTSGIQYYSIYKGNNPKQLINPVIYPQAPRTDVWGNSLTSFGTINSQRAEDITLDNMDYSCCNDQEIASGSLGSSSPYVSRVGAMYGVHAPLPVQMPGEYPKNIPSYSGYSVNGNSWNNQDFPRPINPILEIQRRKAGLPPTPILPDYPESVLKDLKQGFIIS